MELPLPVLAFLMVFAAAASTLLLVGLWAIVERLVLGLALFLRSIPALAHFLLETSYRLINGLVHGAHELSGRAANTAQRFLAAAGQGLNGESATDKLPLAVRLLTSMLSGEDRENISGDLKEEFSQIESKTTAHIWLYKQVLKSVLPLVYKNLKSRLASYFGERVR